MKISKIMGFAVVLTSFLLLCLFVNFGRASTDPRVAGSFNGWSTSVDPMTYVATWGGLAVYERTRFLTGSTQIQYKIYVDDWGDKWWGRDGAPGYYLPQVCQIYNNQGNIYALPPATDNYVFQFRTDGEKWVVLKRKTVQVPGSFNSWNVNDNNMTYIGDNVWRSSTYSVTGPKVENFKFIMGNTYDFYYWGWEYTGTPQDMLHSGTAYRGPNWGTIPYNIKVNFSASTTENFRIRFNPETKEYWVDDLTSPGKPTLASPENDTMVSTSTPTFEWTAVADHSGVTYTLVIDNEPNFDNAYYVYYKTGLTDNQHTVDNELSNGVYYWRVRAVDGASNAGLWSDNFQVTISSYYQVEGVTGNNYSFAQFDARGALFDFMAPLGIWSGMWLPVENQPQLNIYKSVGGVKVGDNYYWLSDPAHWTYSQSYVTDTATIKTVATHKVEPIEVTAYAFAPKNIVFPNDNSGNPIRGMLIQRFFIKNTGPSSLNATFMYYQDMNINGMDNFDNIEYKSAENCLFYHDPGDSASGRTRTMDFGLAFNVEPTNYKVYQITDAGYLDNDLSLGAGENQEVAVFLVGATTPSVDQNLYTSHIKPAVDWFKAANLTNVQDNTENFWTTLLDNITTFDSPDDNYDSLFKRSVITSYLFFDGENAGMGAGGYRAYYYRCWPRDVVYGAITLDRIGIHDIPENVYYWLWNVAERSSSYRFWYQKYALDGVKIWEDPQVDQTAMISSGVWYHYLQTGDSSFLNTYAPLVREAALVSSEDNPHAGLDYNENRKLMFSQSVWEDKWAMFLYSNAAVWAGLRDAALVMEKVGDNENRDLFNARKENIAIGLEGLYNTSTARYDQGFGTKLYYDKPVIVERDVSADVAMLGVVTPFGFKAPNDEKVSRTAKEIEEALTDNNETENAYGGLCRYRENQVARYGIEYENLGDTYYDGGPWMLATLWMSEYYLENADTKIGKDDIDNAKEYLDYIVGYLGNLGLGAEQIDETKDNTEFALETAWPNVWESNGQIVDVLIGFIDYQYNAVENTLEISPKLPSDWSYLGSNIKLKDGRFYIKENVVSDNQIKVNLANNTSENLLVEIYIQTDHEPTTITGTSLNWTYDSYTGRVELYGTFANNTSENVIINFSLGDENLVRWWGAHFDSRDNYYRSPLGSYYIVDNVMGDLVHPDENVTIRIRVYENDVTAVKLRIWKSYAAAEQVLEMSKENADGTYEWWKVDISAPDNVENYWYHFRITDGFDNDYYGDDNARDGSVGQMYDSENNVLDYLLAYRPAATDLQSWVVYQIITDRFYNGDNTNDNCSESPDVDDPTHTNPKMYWGGDLKGIQDKIPYLKEMGVQVIWISPTVNNVDTILIDTAENSDKTQSTAYHGFFAKDWMTIEEHQGNWEVWDNLVSALHDNGIKIILDFALNHSSSVDYDNENFAEKGAFYENGTYLTNAYLDNQSTTQTENAKYYHHYGRIDDWSDRAEMRYASFPHTAPQSQCIPDLNQANPTVDAYLRSALKLFLDHGVDGFRLDAVKAMEQDWLKSIADNIYAYKNVYLVGEWWEGFGSSIWWDMCKFDNVTGINLNNHPLCDDIRDVFAWDHSFQEIEDAIARVDGDILWDEKMFVFLESHDIARFLSLNGNKTRLHQAMVFDLTTVGIPVMYYGTEQYLHDNRINASGVKGGDPYNRTMMENWDTTTTAFKIIQELSRLRKDNPALRYGYHQQRWINSDVYVYERKFFNDVVLVAINKSTNTTYELSSLYTALPPRTYPDQLRGLLGGSSITVSNQWNSTEQGYLVWPRLVIGPLKAMVWHYIAPSPSVPQIGAIDPPLGRENNTVKISGKGFGSSQGTVYFENATENVAATVVSWSNESITVKVPAVGAADNIQVFVSKATGENSDYKIKFSVLSGRQIPVLFRVINTTGTPLETLSGEYLWITGNVAELGKWSTDNTKIVGPMLCHENIEPWDNWRVVASLPAGATIEFKFIRIDENGTVLWENGSNRIWTVPEKGTPLYTGIANQTGSYTVRQDGIAPTIENLKAEPASFNPSQGEKTLISCILSEVVENRTIKIENSTGGLINTFVGSGVRYVTQYWDGRDNIGNIVSADNYTIKVNATDYAGNNATENTTIVEVV